MDASASGASGPVHGSPFPPVPWNDGIPNGFMGLDDGPKFVAACLDQLNGSPDRGKEFDDEEHFLKRKYKKIADRTSIRDHFFNASAESGATRFEWAQHF